MNEITVRGKIFGPSSPAICVPVTEKNIEEFEKKAIEYAKKGVEVIELRADYLGIDVLKEHTVIADMLIRIRSAAPETIFIFTIRTKPEGGTVEFEEDEIRDLYEALLTTKTVDMYDLEYEQLSHINYFVNMVKEGGAISIASHHNFDFTYEADVIEEILTMMKEADADVCKIALMPKSEEDVDRLIASAGSFAKKNPDKAVIAISMGELGMKSRTSCDKTGSMLTFAAMENASAPGQIGYEKMKGLLLK